ncbi:hypothetical protein AAFF_G00056360 [Aldrovandia affinis]|uniref:Uncharacterized protein n=1 Tax=Aldrovandia affinis TaxID=143900 RepID=A0AAD7S190_9TELE|nr:hypothetical protein AAFF_G00056360 [Aldrovandia affinis]
MGRGFPIILRASFLPVYKQVLDSGKEGEAVLSRAVFMKSVRSGDAPLGQRGADSSWQQSRPARSAWGNAARLERQGRFSDVVSEPLASCSWATVVWRRGLRPTRRIGRRMTGACWTRLRASDSRRGVRKRARIRRHLDVKRTADLTLEEGQRRGERCRAARCHGHTAVMCGDPNSQTINHRSEEPAAGTACT